MTPTQAILARDNYVCGYCGARAVQRDHFIKASAWRPEAKAAREDPLYQIAVCRNCNEAIGTRRRVPAFLAGLIPELEELTGGKYATYSGNQRELDAVVK